MKFIIGRKQNMTQIFTDNGTVVPVTVIAASPVTVTQLRTKDRDGYEAVQVAQGKTKKEFIAPGSEVKVGDEINVGTFAEGDVVTVSGISKGKGFQGVVKRHGFAGGRRTHGQKHSEREPGSIGGGGRAGGRVVVGMRMAGRMGSDRTSVKNLQVVKVDPETNTLYIRGAVPGRRGTLVEVVAK